MPVAGNGPQPASGMLVGEAPSIKDEEAGLPFTGRPGRVLDAALRSVGLTRDELYITNVVKNVPLNDEGRIRVPTDDEIAEWLPILAGEIERTAPAAILALGRTAANTLLSRLYGVSGDVPYGSIIGNVVIARHPAWYAAVVAPDYREFVQHITPFAELIAE